MTKIFRIYFFRELKLVLAATSAKANGPTSGEYAAALRKFFQVRKLEFLYHICVSKSIV